MEQESKAGELCSVVTGTQNENSNLVIIAYCMGFMYVCVGGMEPPLQVTFHSVKIALKAFHLL